MEKISYNQIFSFMEALQGVDIKKSKELAWAVERNTTKFITANRRYKDKIYELSRENASIDEKGLLITDDKGAFRYTKETDKKLKHEINELGTHDSGITPYMLKEVTSEIYDLLGIARLESMIGVLITKEQFEEIIKAIEV